MEFAELAETIFYSLKPRLESSRALNVFARERAKFEGWLKVELCECLLDHFSDVSPEVGRVDLSFGDWKVELKTVNTNIRYGGAKNKHRPITRNVQGVIDDIEKLRAGGSGHKAVLFVAFPIEHENRHWQEQLKRMTPLLADIRSRQFRFHEGLPGALYMGLVK